MFQHQQCYNVAHHISTFKETHHSHFCASASNPSFSTPLCFSQDFAYALSPLPGSVLVSHDCGYWRQTQRKKGGPSTKVLIGSFSITTDMFHPDRKKGLPIFRVSSQHSLQPSSGEPATGSHATLEFRASSCKPALSSVCDTWSSPSIKHGPF